MLILQSFQSDPKNVRVRRCLTHFDFLEKTVSRISRKKGEDFQSTMGVHGLWALLSVCGRKISIENLRNKRLAVDVSIWLVQIARAMRDEEGNVAPNAILRVTFFRLCKLLFNKIKPIIVFDGGAPVLKRKTQMRRNNEVLKMEAKRRSAARKLLLRQMRLLEEAKKNGGGDGSFAKGFVEPTTKTTSIETNRNILSEEEVDIVVPPKTTTKTTEQTLRETRDKIEKRKRLERKMHRHQRGKRKHDHDHSLIVDEINLDHHTGNIDTEVFLALPPKTQQEVVDALEARSRRENRKQYLPVAANASAFSETQLDNFLKRSKTRSVIRNARLGQGENGESTKSMASDQSQKFVLTSGDDLSKIESLFRTKTLSVKRTTVKTRKPKDATRPDVFETLPSFLTKTYDKDVFTSKKEAKATESTIDLTKDEEEEEEEDELFSLMDEVKKNKMKHAFSEQKKRKRKVEFSRVGNHAILLKINTNNLEASDGFSRDVFSKKKRKIEEDWEEVKTENDCDDEEDDWEEVKDGEESEEWNEDDVYHENLKKEEERVGTGFIIEDDEKMAGGFVVEEEQEEKDEEEIEDDRDNSKILAMKPYVSPWNTTSKSNTSVDFDDDDDDVIIKSTVLLDKKDTMGGFMMQENIEEDDEEEEEETATVVSNAIKTASAIAPWAGRVVEKVVGSLRSTKKKTKSVSDDDDEEEEDEDVNASYTISRTAAKDSEKQEIQDEIIKLLEIMGIPYIISPSEAEAQCAKLEELGLVDGIITNDSDAFLFGAKRIYRNFFEHSKVVEEYRVSDLRNEMGLDRKNLVSMALMLGGDYTDGIKGIGIVNACEILAAFDRTDKQDEFLALTQFREWLTSLSPPSIPKKNQEDMSEKHRFMLKHASSRNKWITNEDFPNIQVIDAYMKPNVDKSTKSFSWSRPDREKLESFCLNKLDLIRGQGKVFM